MKRSLVYSLEYFYLFLIEKYLEENLPITGNIHYLYLVYYTAGIIK